VCAEDKAEDNPLRKIFVAYFAFSALAREFQANIDELPTGFIKDVMNALMAYHDRQQRLQGNIGAATDYFAKDLEKEAK